MYMCAIKKTRRVVHCLHQRHQGQGHRSRPATPTGCHVTSQRRSRLVSRWCWSATFLHCGILVLYKLKTGRYINVDKIKRKLIPFLCICPFYRDLRCHIPMLLNTISTFSKLISSKNVSIVQLYEMSQNVCTLLC